MAVEGSTLCCADCATYNVGHRPCEHHLPRHANLCMGQEISYFWSAVDSSSTSFTAVLCSIHHPLPCLCLCFEHRFSHASFSLLHSLFDTPHIRYFMCTCVYPGVVDQWCVAHIKLSHLSRERQTCWRLWLMASDNITASYLYFLPPPPVFPLRSKELPECTEEVISCSTCSQR